MAANLVVEQPGRLGLDELCFLQPPHKRHVEGDGHEGGGTGIVNEIRTALLILLVAFATIIGVGLTGLVLALAVQIVRVVFFGA